MYVYDPIIEEEGQQITDPYTAVRCQVSDGRYIEIQECRPGVLRIRASDEKVLVTPVACNTVEIKTEEL